MLTAFVTGGSGFLGTNLVQLLAARGWRVIVFDRKPPDLGPDQPAEVQTILGDIINREACWRAMPPAVDAVFHLAGDTSHWKLADAQQTRVNVLGTRSVVAAALSRSARRLVHTSSIAAYGFHPDTIDEHCQSRAMEAPINYFQSKHQAELEVRRGIAQGLDAVLLNPANIIGPHDHGGWSRLFKLIQQGRLPGVPPGRGSFCHVGEVAQAHLAAFERGRCGHNYLLGGADASFVELVGEIGRLLGRPVPERPTPALALKAWGRLSLWGSYFTRREPELTPEKALLVCSRLVCSSSKAASELGYGQVPLLAMLKDCHRWMTQAGLL